VAFTDREVALENEMAERGRERRQSALSRTRRLGRESLTPAGHHLVRAAMGRVVEALEAWKKAQGDEHETRRSDSYALLLQVPLRPVALLTLRASLDGATRGDSWQGAVHAVARAVDEERMGRWLSDQHAGSWTSIRRRAKLIPNRAGSRLRRSARHLARERGYSRWSNAERLRLGALLLETAERTAGLFTVERVRVTARRSRLVLRLLPEVVEWIAGADSRDLALAPLYLPMVDEPGDWGPGQAGGYSTGLVARKHLVKNRSRVTRELVAGADMPAVYGAVNALQRTAWEVNPDVLEVARELFAQGRDIPGLASSEDPLQPERPAGAPTTLWLRQAFLARRAGADRAARRAEASRVLWLAGRMESEGRFHYPQQLDFRGRVYPVPQFLQPQGPDLSRGLLRFCDGDYLRRADSEDFWFWIHGANCLGLDKLPLAERRQRLLAEAANVRAVAQDPLDCAWWQEADKPWQFLAWCLEAGPLLETGRTLTRVPCYVDGTNNGLQILSLLLRDPAGGAATNCAPSDRRRDIYQDVADEVTRRLRDVDDETARGWMAWMPAGVPRAATKRPVMTLPYGCTRWSVSQYVADWYEEELRQGRPPAWEGPWWPRVVALADHLWFAIEALLGRAIECMAWMRDVSRLCIESGVGPTWTAPSGFPVRQSYTNWEVQTVRTKFGERVRWVRSRRSGERLNLRRHVNGLPPNFVHSLDAAVLARVLSGFDGPVSSIHDSFGTTAPRVAGMGRRIREAYASTFEADLLGNLRDQLTALAGGRVQVPEPPARGDLDPRAVIGSDYLFS
jgi:DNA-directed RNA polymerase